LLKTYFKNPSHTFPPKLRVVCSSARYRIPLYNQDFSASLFHIAVDQTLFFSLLIFSTLVFLRLSLSNEIARAISLESVSLGNTKLHLQLNSLMITSNVCSSPCSII
jgi:hypothetical protein